jgi:hypothetical protein
MMMQRNATSLLVAGFLFLAGGRADADGMRCGNRLVSSGDSLYEVAQTCGDPDARENRVEYHTVRYSVPAPCPVGAGAPPPPRGGCRVIVEKTVSVVIDEWTYDFGKNRFIQRVRFEQGKLVSVASDGYGHKG